jgi:hypothetical protein
MRFLRAVKGCTRQDRPRNEDIRNELGVEPIQYKLSNYRENWKTHLERTPEERIPNHSINLGVGVPVGRPCKWWNQMWDRNRL